MYIESILIESFGSYKNFSVKLGENINIIEGRNESGKSTLGAFVKFIFYGLAKKAPAQAKLSELKRYKSWENDSASGSLTLCCDGKRYRIERTLKPGTRSLETLKIIDLETNTETLKGENPGKYFFGLDEDAFSQTAFLSQADGGKINGKPVGVAIENMLFSGDESLGTAQAQKKLDKARVALRYKIGRGGRIAELEDRQSALQNTLDAFRESGRLLLSKEKEKLVLSEECEKEREAILKLENELENAEKSIFAREKLSLIDRYSELKNAYDEKQEKYEKVKESISVNGKIPSENDALDIEKLSYERNRIVNEISELSAEKEGNSPEKDKINVSEWENEFYERVASDGGKDKIAKELSAFTEGCKKARKYASVSLAVCGILLALARILFIFKENITVFPGIVGILLAILSAVGATLLWRKSKEVKANEKIFRAKYLPVKVENIGEKLAEIDKKRSLLALYGENADILSKRLEKLENERKNIEKALSERLALVSAEDFSLENASACAEKIRKNLSLLKNAQDDKVFAENALAESGKALPEETRESLEENITYDGNIRTRDSLFDAKAELERRKRANEMLADDVHMLDIECAKLSASHVDPLALSDEIESVKLEIDRLEKQCDGYVLAYKALANASDRLRRDVSPHLASRASEFLSAQTLGKYSSLGVDRDFSMQYTSGNEADGNLATREIEYLSEGTKDLAYLSLRLALVEMLFTKALPPLIFDESFARLDDKRLESTFKILRGASQNGCQIFIFTSQTRDKNIMSRLGDFEHINLSGE